jgi:hypothetical protein
MLQRSPFSTSNFSKQASVLTGQSIAKSAHHRTPRQRAKPAAAWVKGGVYIQPTVALAARVFQCSAKLVAEELAKLKTTRPTPAPDAWQAMDITTKHEFVRKHLAEIWTVIETITAA